MNWLNLELTTLRSEQFLGSEPVERATWLCLMVYCADQENSGTIKDCREWGDRKWMQLVGITATEANSPSPLWTWTGKDLSVWGYPEDKQAEVQRLRSQARNAARKRWGNANSMPKGIPQGIQKGNGVGNAEVEVEGNKKENKKENKKKKATRREQHDAAVFAFALPEKYSVQFAEAWQEFCDHRADMSAWLTERALKQLLKTLDPLTEQQAIAALNKSVANGWKGVFPDKPQSYGKPTQVIRQMPTDAEYAASENVERDENGIPKF